MGKSRRIECLLVVRVAESWVSNKVCPAIVNKARGIPDVCHVDTIIGERQRNPGVRRQIYVCLPTAKDGGADAAAHETLAFPEGQFINSPPVDDVSKAVSGCAVILAQVVVVLYHGKTPWAIFNVVEAARPVVQRL